LFKHDLFGKPDSTFPDHAVAGDVSLFCRLPLTISNSLLGYLPR
jgi:hypothetical protein